MKSMQVRLTEEQIRALDGLVSSKFSSRNEAVREAVRHLIVQYARTAEFKWHIFGPRSRNDMRKIVESSRGMKGISVPEKVMATLEKLI